MADLVECWEPTHHRYPHGRAAFCVEPVEAQEITEERAALYPRFPPLDNDKES